MKNFEERLNDLLKITLDESNDITDMSSKQYTNGADKDSQKPSDGTVRTPNKEWFGGHAIGPKMPTHSSVSSKNTNGDGPKVD